MRTRFVLFLSLAAAQFSVSLPSSGPVDELSIRLDRRSRDVMSLTSRHEDDDDGNEAQGRGEAERYAEEANDSGAEAMASAAPTSHSHMASPSEAHPASTDHHHSHAAPLIELNETQILLTHSPDPPSYFDFDQSDDGKPALLYIHIVLMSVAFFGFLPLAIFLKAGRSALSIVPQTAFLVTSIIGLFFGQVYNGLTPNMYEHSSHTSIGWWLMALALALNVVDVARFLLRFTAWGKKVHASLSDYTAVSDYAHNKASEIVFQLGEDEDDSNSESACLVQAPIPGAHDQGNSAHLPPVDDGHRSTPVGQSFSDEETVHDAAAADSAASWRGAVAGGLSPRAQQWRRYGDLSLDFAQRMLILLGYLEVCTGVAVWTGTCRERYLNGCLAHVIKGSIFVWYGLLTFARYCGAFSSLGWAWNRHPSRTTTIWTAEFVESTVITLHGSTQVWMERWGHTTPWSVKDVQHASIDILFWTGGMLGMLLESRAVRSWLSTPAAQASGRSLSAITPPAGAAFSFNPFPALCIFVIGVAMAAHHQVYMFQIEVHALWGHLLAAFAVFRFLTYFFLYLRPPASILPSLPPTEALASLCLTSGGVVFLLSTEQVTFAAMRHQADDVMAFLCLTVALVCAWFLWTAVLFSVKGWALSRNTPVSGVSLRSKHVALP